MTATANIAAHVADRVALADGWLMWRDFAVRSASFPIDGLGAFGPGDESARLRAVARDAAFREAMTWQNPAAVANALDKLKDAAGSSKARRREDVVASYWQRYCAKNDTIGFYGPLAGGGSSTRRRTPCTRTAGAAVITGLAAVPRTTSPAGAWRSLCGRSGPARRRRPFWCCTPSGGRTTRRAGARGKRPRLPA